jgi:hypothetical protein
VFGGGLLAQRFRARRAARAEAVLLLSLLVAAYLVYQGLSTSMVGLLRWPAAALHALIAVMLARTLLASRGAAH